MVRSPARDRAMHVARGESAPCALSRSSRSAFAVRGALPPLVVFFLRPARAASPLLRCVPEPLSGDAQGTSHERYATHSPSGARALSLSSSGASGLALFFFSSSSRLVSSTSACSACCASLASPRHERTRDARGVRRRHTGRALSAMGCARTPRALAYCPNQLFVC